MQNGGLWTNKRGVLCFWGVMGTLQNAKYEPVFCYAVIKTPDNSTSSFCSRRKISDVYLNTRIHTEGNKHARNSSKLCFIHPCAAGGITSTIQTSTIRLHIIKPVVSKPNLPS